MNYEEFKLSERKIIKKLLNNQELTPEEVKACIDYMQIVYEIPKYDSYLHDTKKITIIEVGYDKCNYPHTAYYSLFYIEGIENLTQNKYESQIGVRVYPKEEQITIRLWETENGEDVKKIERYAW